MNRTPVTIPVTPVTVVFLLSLLSACNVGSNPESVDARLYFAAKALTADTTTIPIKPSTDSSRNQVELFHFDLQADTNPVSVRKLVIGVQASADLSQVLAEAEIRFSGRTYSLTNIKREGAQTELLVFALPKDADLLATADEALQLTLLARFRHSAAGQHLQARITPETRRQTAAYEAGTNNRLPSDRKTGAAYGKQYRLKRTGAHLTVQKMSTQEVGQDVRFEADISVSAFATDISIPWRVYQKEASTPKYSRAGFHFAVEDTTGKHPANGRVLAAALEYKTSIPPASNPSTDELQLKASQEQALTLSVRYQPDNQNTDKHCFRLKALRYQDNKRERTLTLSDTKHATCW